MNRENFQRSLPFALLLLAAFGCGQPLSSTGSHPTTGLAVATSPASMETPSSPALPSAAPTAPSTTISTGSNGTLSETMPAYLPPTTPYEGKILSEWISSLDSKDQTVRLKSVDAVRRYGPNAKDAVPLLILILQDPRDEAFASAFSAIAAIGPAADMAVNRLVELLRHNQVDTRCLAASTLGRLGAVSALPELRTLLSSSDEQVRNSSAKAIEAIEAIGPPNAKGEPNPKPAPSNSGLFAWEKLAGSAAPSIFALRMGMTPEELNRMIVKAGGVPLIEAAPDRDAKRVGVERPLEPEIQLFQAETKQLKGLLLPNGFDKVTFVFAEGRLYKITLYAKFFWSNMSPRNLMTANIARNIPKYEAEITADKAEANLNLADMPSLRLFVDRVDIRPEPGVTLKGFRNVLDSVWQKDPRLAELAVVAASTYEKGGVVLTPQFYINQDTQKGGFTTVRKSGGLAVVFDATGWVLDVGDESDGIRKREFHCHWFWSDFVEKCGSDYLSKKSTKSSPSIDANLKAAIPLESGSKGKPVITYKGKSLDDLVKMLKDTDPKTRAEAAFAFSDLGLGAKEAEKALAIALRDSNSEVANFAATALGNIGEDGVAPLILALQDRKEGLRGSAMVGLHQSGKIAVPALVRLLSSPEKTTVTSAASVLVKIGPPALPGLIAALKNENIQVRGFAVIAIGRIEGDVKEAIPAVTELLRDNHPGVRAAAEETLKKINPDIK